MSEKYVFAVHFKCENCGNKFNRKFKENYMVRKNYNDMIYYDYRDGDILKAEYITCPNCNVDKEIVIVKRKPIKNGDAK